MDWWSQLCIVFTKENLRVTCGDLEKLVIEIDNGKGKTVFIQLRLQVTQWVS